MRAAYGGVTNREWVQVRPLSRQSLVTPLRLARPALLVLVMLLASLSPILMLPEQKEQTIDDLRWVLSIVGDWFLISIDGEIRFFNSCSF